MPLRTQLGLLSLGLLLGGLLGGGLPGLLGLGLDCLSLLMDLLRGHAGNLGLGLSLSLSEDLLSLGLDFCLHLGLGLGLGLGFLPQTHLLQAGLDGLIEGGLGDVGLLELTGNQLNHGGVVDELTALGHGHQHLHIGPSPVARSLVLASDDTQLGEIGALAGMGDCHDGLGLGGQVGHAMGALGDQLVDVLLQQSHGIGLEHVIVLIFGDPLVLLGTEISRIPQDADVGGVGDGELAEALTEGGLVQALVGLPAGLLGEEGCQLLVGPVEVGLEASGGHLNGDSIGTDQGGGGLGGGGLGGGGDGLLHDDTSAVRDASLQNIRIGTAVPPGDSIKTRQGVPRQGGTGVRSGVVPSTTIRIFPREASLGYSHYN